MNLQSDPTLAARAFRMHAGAEVAEALAAHIERYSSDWLPKLRSLWLRSAAPGLQAVRNNREAVRLIESMWGHDSGSLVDTLNATDPEAYGDPVAELEAEQALAARSFPFSAGDVLSEGTLRDEDIVPALVNALQTLIDSGHAPEGAAELLDDTEPVEVWERIDELFEALDAACPSHLTFGALEGDGACFGFWLTEEAEEAEERYNAARALLDVSETHPCESDDDNPVSYRELGPAQPIDWPSLEAYLSDPTVLDCYWIAVPHTTEGNFETDLVAKSNRLALVADGADAKEHPGIGTGEWYSDAIGPHDDDSLLEGVLDFGTFGVYVCLGSPLDTLTQATETIDGLNDYPLVNDETYSILETEAENENWNDYGAQDFANALESRIGVNVDPSEGDNVEELHMLYREICEGAGRYPETDGTGSTNFREDELAKYLVGLELTDEPPRLLALTGARWSDGIPTDEYGEPDPIDLDNHRAGPQRQDEEKDAERAARHYGHTMGRWSQTHPARSRATCADCGAQVVVNVRPAPGAPQQRRTHGPALDNRCERPHVTLKPDGSEGPHWQVVSGSRVFSAHNDRQSADAAAERAWRSWRASNPS